MAQVQVLAQAQAQAQVLGFLRHFSSGLFFGLFSCFGAGGKAQGAYSVGAVPLIKASYSMFRRRSVARALKDFNHDPRVTVPRTGI